MDLSSIRMPQHPLFLNRMNIAKGWQCDNYYLEHFSSLDLDHGCIEEGFYGSN